MLSIQETQGQPWTLGGDTCRNPVWPAETVARDGANYGCTREEAKFGFRKEVNGPSSDNKDAFMAKQDLQTFILCVERRKAR